MNVDAAAPSHSAMAPVIAHAWRRAMSHRKVPAGTTLIELLIVLAIISLLTALAVPSMTGYLERARVRGALDRVTGELYQARVLAVREGTRVQLRFVPNRGCAARYELFRMDRDEVMRVVTVDGPGVCLRSNVARGFSIDSRGLILGSSRTVFASAGGEKDSLIISIVGRVFRSR
jgi:prepilin-type N-terminal cleavage/methylation domain-containing protein